MRVDFRELLFVAERTTKLWRSVLEGFVHGAAAGVRESRD
jgi:hypothetical protein